MPVPACNHQIQEVRHKNLVDMEEMNSCQEERERERVRMSSCLEVSFINFSLSIFPFTNFY